LKLANAVWKRISHVLAHFAIELFHLDLELGLQVVDVLLVFEHLLAQLVPLVRQRLMLPLQLLVVAFALSR
jgi:hypothetical protein